MHDAIGVQFCWAFSPSAYNFVGLSVPDISVRFSPCNGLLGFAIPCVEMLGFDRSWGNEADDSGNYLTVCTVWVRCITCATVVKLLILVVNASFWWMMCKFVIMLLKCIACIFLHFCFCIDRCFLVLSTPWGQSLINLSVRSILKLSDRIPAVGGWCCGLIFEIRRQS
jgi:hypothetical protein